MEKTWKALVALLLVVLLFLCIAALSNTTTKTFAAPTDATVLPTLGVSVTIEPSASPTAKPSSTPEPSPTPKPSPTKAPNPTPTATLVPTATPQPTATSVPTAVPSPTVGTTPTAVVATPTAVVKPTRVPPTPIATQKAGASPIPLPTRGPMPTVVPTQPATTPVDISSTHKKRISPEQSPLHNDSPIMPLVVGTLLTLCLGAGGFVGIRHVRTALLPAIDMKKQRNHTFARSWQRVRTIPQQAVPLLPVQETTLPSLPQNSATSLSRVEIPLSAIADEGPKTGQHRRLGPVRLRKMTEAAEPPVEARTVRPTDIEDVSFLDDPLLQDTLRHYRQKGKQQSQGPGHPQGDAPPI